MQLQSARCWLRAAELLDGHQRLQAASVTRWNSQLSMVRSILRIPEDKLRSLDTQYQLTLYDRNILKDMIDILTPFESATNCVRGQSIVAADNITIFNRTGTPLEGNAIASVNME